MKRLIKLLIVIIFSFTTLTIISIFWGRSAKTSINPNLIKEILDYCKKNQLDTNYCIIVDFSIYSGKERLFIVDIPNNRIDVSGLCAHGIGKDFDCIFRPKFSNKNGSNYSSLGHYRLGRRRKTSQYDLNAIELHGLDSSNSNAYQRGILIHDGLPDISIIGLPCAPLSQGCFTVSDYTFDIICNVKGDSNKAILLYATDKCIF